MKKINSLIVVFFIYQSALFSQVNISEFIQDSKIASIEENSLFFIDFWATWCAPCVTAKQQLGVLQKQFPDNFYVVSISEESPALVKKYLTKRPTDLAIAIDLGNQTHKQFNVPSYPFGVLLNANGDVLWKGKTPNLTSKIIKKTLKNNRKKIKNSAFFIINTLKEDITSDYVPKNDIELIKTVAIQPNLDIYKVRDYIKYTGSLKHILSKLKNISPQFIETDNKTADFTLYFKSDLKSEAVYNYILQQLKVSLKPIKVKKETLVLSLINENLLWDMNQINWGNSTSKFLISDTNIKADNITFDELALKLSNAKELPVIIEGIAHLRNQKHDWDIHYKYDQLMLPALKDGFGIDAKKEHRVITMYKIVSTNSKM